MIQKSVYQHYKGNFYEVIDTAQHSETLEPMVVYRALYGEHALWVRPLTLFMEFLDEGKTPRFKFASEKCEDSQSILADLKNREPIFHHPDKFGKTEQDLLNMIDEEFWEVGASGKRYSREDVIATLLQRYADSTYGDRWETKDFELLEIAPNNYLLTYVLIQGQRITKRATIWRRTTEGWKIVYHQGTIVQENVSREN